MSTITIEPQGFAIVAGDRVHRIAWVSIREIRAYKVDVWSYDLICLSFHVDAAESCLELDEDYAGYESLIAELDRRYPLSEGWWGQVAFPAFEECRTTIWRRVDCSRPNSHTTDTPPCTTDEP